MATKKASRVPELGEHIPRQRRYLRRAFAILVMYVTGWRISGDAPNLPKFIAIGGPHTSNWDIIVTLGTIWILDLKVSWLVKDSAARWPFTGFIKSLGGIPVNRKAPGGIVGQVIEQFDKMDAFALLIAPEGTRSRVKRWKTGFHRIAQATGLPVLTVTLDFRNRTVILNPLFDTTPDLEADLEYLQGLMKQGSGHNVELE